MREALIVHVLNVALGAIVLLGLAACAGPSGLPTEGYPRAYAVGFDDGCRSGKQAAREDLERARSDNPRIDADPTYARGWNDGYERCERSEKAFAQRMKEAEEQKRLESELGRGVPLKGGERNKLETPPQLERSP